MGHSKDNIVARNRLTAATELPGQQSFGAGPRMCIGATFAMMEIKLALAMIVQRYRLTLAPNTRIDRQVKITLSSKHGMPMIVAAQDRRFAQGVTAVRGNVHEMVDLR